MIAFDDEVDDAYFAIEEGIQSLLARQTPVATDLRLVLAMLHVNLHLERMADYCVTVAKLTKLAATGSREPRIVASMAEMGVRAEEMTRVALRSFQHRDVSRAESLVDLDELIDRANRRLPSTSWSSAPTSASGACGCWSSRAAWSGSATTRWTSASRRRTW